MEKSGKNAVVDDVGGGGEKWGLPIHQYGNQLPTVLLSGHTKFNATKNLLKIDFWNPSFTCENIRLFGNLFVDFLYFWRIFSRFPERIYHVKLSFVIPTVPLAGHPDWAPDRTLLFIINQRFFAVHSTQLFVFSSFF